jgi:nucleoside 2-deoxyribosyltransferase
MRAYIAAPFGEQNSDKRMNAWVASEIMVNKGYEVFMPWAYQIPHAWDYPNAEWGQMVFMNDLKAIDGADIVVVLSYGRESTAGTNWEAGYAFGTGKTVIVVEMTDEVMSLMVSNGMYARIKGLDGLRDYDFDKMPKSRTDTEQK